MLTVSTSRKKRKRYRARGQSRPEATAANGPNAPDQAPRMKGGRGESAEISRRDLALIRRAVNADWPMGRGLRRRLVSVLANGLDLREDSQGPSRSTRWTLSACRVVVAMSEANLRARERSSDACAGVLPLTAQHCGRSEAHSAYTK